MLRSPLVLRVFLCMCLAIVYPLPTQAVDPEDCRKLLEDSLISFYLPSVDSINGGYMEVLDADGEFVTGEKFLTLQARQLWFFSTLAVHGIRKDASLAAADSGYQFLQEHFYDAAHGGYYTKTSAAGTPSDRRKHVYPNAFVIYGLVEYYRASGKQEALEQAQALFNTLEQNCYDRQNGGYHEFFYEDWRLITDPSESGYVGAINTKTYNSHLHLLEAFAQLYRETQEALVAQRLRELIQINVVRVKHPEHLCNIDGWTPTWKMIQTPRNLRASYGHDVECAWLVLDACEALGEFPNIREAQDIESWAKELCDFAIRYGYDHEHGGFYSSGPPGEAADDRRKIWWVQTEALVAMLTLAQRTGDAEYERIFEHCWDFTSKHQIAPQGGWWDTVNRDGSLGEKKVRTSMWQGAYHNGRALLKLASMLENHHTNP